MIINLKYSTTEISPRKTGLFTEPENEPVCFIGYLASSMQLTAKLIQLLPLQTGTGKNGQWKKQDIIVETEATYPKKVCISIWGDKIDASRLQPGSLLKIDFDVESREFNGRWYTDVKAWKVEPAGSGSTPAAESYTDQPSPENIKYDDDLP